MPVFERDASSLPAGERVGAASAHLFQRDDERAAQACLKMKDASVLLAGFISLNPGVFSAPALASLPPPPPTPSSPISIQALAPLSGANCPWPSGVIWSQRRALMGSQRHSEDFDGQIETNRRDFHRGGSAAPPRSH